MYLHREDIKRIQEILEQFPNVESFEICQDNGSGIGSHTTIIFETKINNVDGNFEVVVSSIENW